ncbi:MAG: hypothetical protein WC584_00710 [Candidatus Pacearchaeota archaeon]
MPFCGFNREMLEGLENFHVGLVETSMSNEKFSELKAESEER